MASGHPDPERRDRIVRAAIEVVAERGVERLTHRAVAQRAGVPLGSTTYHFADRDALLVAALRQAAADNVASLAPWVARRRAGEDLAEVLADLLAHWCGPARRRTVVEYELYLAALRRPVLRPHSTAWVREVVGVLAAELGREHAVLLGYLVDGLLVQALMRDEPPGRDELLDALRRVLPA